jgi:flagellar biosynthesis/type III secretory pathway chaperone
MITCDLQNPTATSLREDERIADKHRRETAQSAALDQCLSAAHQLLGLLREETLALKGFQGDRLLQLLTHKEALIADLSLRVRTILPTSSQPDEAPTQPTSAPRPPHPQSVTKSNRYEDKRHSLRHLLTEIEQCNRTNRIFIQGSLDYCQDLLNIFLPGTYAPGQEGQATRQMVSTKGLALNKEI